MKTLSSLVTLEPGLYILRHPKSGMPPLTVSRALGDRSCVAKIDILSTPNAHNSMLRDGADCIVMLVSDGSVELLVTAYFEKTTSTDDEIKPALRVDKIALDKEVATSSNATAETQSRSIQISDKGLSIIGHIERKGDVVAEEGHPLSEPGSDLRIEGFQIMWPDKPVGIELVYSISLEGIGSTSSVQTGQFCGRRGEARRITEVTFALVGPEASRYQLDGLVHFSGGFQVPVLSGMSLSGPSGLEHLTSITLSSSAVIPGKVKTKKNPWEESPQTKVFKSKPSTKTPASKKTTKSD
jgi:hypothetical protein